MPAAIKKIDRKVHQLKSDCYFVTAKAVQSKLKPEHFDPAYLKQQASSSSQSNGRAKVWFFDITDTDQAVLRHYHRGGMIAKIAGDRFLWKGINATRAVNEYRLCEMMFAEGLPVPEPLGARVQRHGIFYTCDLITRLHPHSRTLAQIISDTTLKEDLWYETGKTIRQVHQFNVWHSDLNANNILIDNEGQVKLIDFDRCKRRSGEHWKQQNLERLRRSLDKLLRLKQIQYFDDSVWQQLLNGYSRSMTTQQSQ